MRAIDALGHLPRRGDRKGRVGQMRNWPVSGSGPAQDHCLRPWQPTPWHAMPTPWHATQQNEWIAERSAARAKKRATAETLSEWIRCKFERAGPDGWADGRACLRRACVALAKEKPPYVLLTGCRRSVQQILLIGNLNISFLWMCLFSKNRDCCGEYQIKREDHRPLSANN